MGSLFCYHHEMKLVINEWTKPEVQLGCESVLEKVDTKHGNRLIS